jgi:hypothetical protein
MLSTESEPMSPPILVLNVSPCSRLNGRLHSVCTWGCVCVCVCVCVVLNMSSCRRLHGLLLSTQCSDAKPVRGATPYTPRYGEVSNKFLISLSPPSTVNPRPATPRHVPSGFKTLG